MVKKGDDVAVDDIDDDAVRYRMLQNPATVTLCTEELFLRTQRI
jgi:hypothetical protein